MKKLLKLNFKNRVLEFIPESILKLLEDDVYLSGGAIRAYINSEEVKDFDLFILDKNKMELIKNNLKNDGFRIIFECPEGKLFSLKKKKLKVQLIYNEAYNCPEDILYSFDFTITQFVLVNGILFTTKQAIKDTLSRKLRFNTIQYPSATLGRLYKYQKRGYHLDEEAKRDFVTRLISNSEEIVDAELVYID